MSAFTSITDYPIIASSFSASDVYLTCPRKYHAEKIEKSVPYEESEHTRYGKYVHKCFEDAVAHGVPLPDELKNHQKMVEWILEQGNDGTIFCEERLGLTDKYEPCAFFAKKQTVMWRAILDVLIVKSNMAIIIDYKTNEKIKSDFSQLRQSAAIIMIKYPMVESVVLAYYFTKHGKVVKDVMTRDDLTMEVNKIRGTAYRIAKAASEGNWFATPNGLCRKWCGVKSCEHNG